MTTTLWAVADLHAAVKANTARIDEIQPRDPSDWLIVAGDVAERTELVISILNKLRKRFAKVIWVPGNHELFSRSTDRYQGRAKYDELVAGCRKIGVLTPEDPYPIFHGITIVPLFTLYDYSFRPQGTTVEEAIAQARAKQIMLTDEFAIAPFVDIRGWCWDRLAYSIKRLSRISGPTILINHWPLVVEPINYLRSPEIGLWCGTRHTRHWAQRYNAQAVIYGHLHMPSEIVVDGVTHCEVSLGYPKEWRVHGDKQPWPYPVMEVD
ncbi:Serine/threonine-specific protein phosphatase [Corynebacterium kutscheri]|uniref:Putative phosphohydrolase n=1 Tax=Corynebacterium kutscheri TaxID=35755 RepID=A0A0F6TDQ7_9CORY|nr:metallophosphoesterase [Corynebacterium kutscheri]AKE41439.1 putative phosphohydrolase [Corynebacterium kutscheri]VEH08716.1 Serine/threonine-specific protein phosphatase [Corynebacterium kutscheri]VEH09763.1 Serine/threonine-specific protein phosphatase [Corynebacterium kutscheri]VEH79846.1 Serine/threonine-specific protein phosphatase [Corynebacterium kutscheri]